MSVSATEVELALQLAQGSDWSRALGGFCSTVLQWDGWELAELWSGVSGHLSRSHTAAEDGSMRAVAATDRHVLRRPPGQGVELLWVPDTSASADTKPAARRGYTSLLVIPAAAGDAHRGCLVLYASHAAPQGLEALVAATPLLSATLALRLRELELLEAVGVIVGEDIAIANTDEQHRILTVNEVWQKLTGFPVEATIGTELPGYTHDDDRELLRRGIDRVVGGHGPIDVEARLQREDGTYTWVNFHASRSANQKLTLTLRDVSAQRRSRELLELVVTNTTDVIALIDAAGSYEYVSPSIEGLLGVPADDLVGAHFGNHVHPDDLAQFDGLLARLTPQEPVTIVFRAVAADGSTAWAEALARPIHSPEGAVTHVQVSIRDVTARVEMETELARARDEALEAVRLKAAFLANMSHEIRTPMNGVIGMTELLAETSLTSEQAEFVHVVRSSAQALLTIINDILDFSKIEAGKLHIESTEFDLRRVCADVLGLFAEKAASRGLRLVHGIADQLPSLVLGDPVRLRQVLTNLVGNAVKFTEHGHVELALAPGPRFADGGFMLRVTVADTGIGMPEWAQARVFDVFQQADTSTTRRFGGTGLGLAISKQLVELMGGRIEVESEEGVGSTFRFEVRLAAARETTQRHAEPPGEEPRAAALRDQGELVAGLRVLLAEDNAVNQKVAVRNLEKLGCKVRCVADGNAAVEAARSGSFDVVLMDCQMPVLDGWGATRLLRRHGYRGPIIALTANAMAGDREACLSAGMDDHLTKPLDPAALLAVLARFSPGRRSVAAEGSPLGS